MPAGRWLPAPRAIPTRPHYKSDIFSGHVVTNWPVHGCRWHHTWMLEATKNPNTVQNAGTAADVPANPALAAEAKIARIAVTIFPILVVAAGVAGFLLPGAFKPLAPSVPFLLGIIMFCMGLTLTPPDFASVAKRPWAVALGIVAHYVIMPGAGWLIAVALHLEPELAVGLILVGCAPSGTASNVMAYLAKGD